MTDHSADDDPTVMVPAVHPATPDDAADDEPTVMVPAVQPATPDDAAADRTAAITNPRRGARSVVDQPPVPELAPGSTIGERYRLTALVGTDTHGNRFWRARDTVLPRDMAVTLLPDSSGTSATVARTLRAGRLRHIGLPQTLDLGSENGQTFVVGQWVDGATLTDLLAKGPLEPAVASAIAGRVSEAVAEAHRNGLALGSIHPSLVRVNVDGQARFSHVIAHATATPDDDIRAVGALLYLMLTGTWPASDQLAPLTDTSLPSAPQRDGRELPADVAVPGVPQALAQLTAGALHPEGPDGIHAVAALASLLQTPDPSASGGGSLRAPERSEPEVPPPTMSPADRRLRKERRVKISIASAFIAAFVALILIVAGTFARNTLVSINDQNQSQLDPLADRPSTSVAAPTTVAESGRPTTSGSSTSAPASSTASSSSAPVAQQMTIVGAEVYDPEGTGKKDNVDFLDRLWDGDPQTEWETWVYKQQFRSKAEGGYKVGVGVILQFDRPITPQSVEINSSDTGMTVQIRTATGFPLGAVDSTTLLATGGVAGGPVVIPVTGAPSSQYLLVFLNQIPGAESIWRGRIGEIVVKGS